MRSERFAAHGVQVDRHGGRYVAHANSQRQRQVNARRRADGAFLDQEQIRQRFFQRAAFGLGHGVYALRDLLHKRRHFGRKRHAHGLHHPVRHVGVPGGDQRNERLLRRGQRGQRGVLRVRQDCPRAYDLNARAVALQRGNCAGSGVGVRGVLRGGCGCRGCFRRCAPRGRRARLLRGCRIRGAAGLIRAERGQRGGIARGALRGALGRRRSGRAGGRLGRAERGLLRWGGRGGDDRFSRRLFGTTTGANAFFIIGVRLRCACVIRNVLAVQL